MNPRRVPLWAAYLAVGALACALYVFVPPLKGSGPVMNLIGLSPVIAIFFGIRRHRPARPRAWGLLAAGSALFWLGDLYTYSYPKLLHADVPFPSVGDGLYIAMYPVMMAGLLMLVRSRSGGPDRSSLIDGMILTVGLALPSWVALIAPYLHADDLGLAGKLVSVAYPVGDVVLLGAAVRLALDSGRREPAFYLLGASITLLLITDFVYGLLTLHGGYDHQLWLDAGWIGSYLLWGAAGLHPSMARVAQPVPGREAVLNNFRLGLLTCASLIAPVIGILHDLRTGDDDYAVVRGASIMLFGLVIARMAGLVRQRDHSLRRERVLSGAGTDLVAATSREEIERVALRAAHELGGPDTVAAIGEGGDGLVVPLPTRRAEAGALVITGAGDGERGAFEALATQTALALDSAVLSEEVHRRRSEARFGALVRHASDLITVLDRDARVTYQSPSIERILGIGADRVLGRRFEELVAEDDRARLAHALEAVVAGQSVQALECSLSHQDGSARSFEILFTDLLDEEHVGGILLNARDVSERKAFEAELTHQAFHDPVTGLANRAMFTERVRQAIARGRREERSLAVIFLDLDDFKTINDSLGHAAGDEVLVEVARRLDGNTRGTDTAARFGGDEFAVLMEDIDGSTTAADAAERILATLAEGMRAGHREVAIRGSLGISVALPGDTRSAEDLIRDADSAMYIAKREGKGAYRLFEPAMHEDVLARLELRSDLQRALDTGQFELHYQPVVHLADGSMSGVEALLRWRHPERGLVPPLDFIPIAEETGLIVPIGRWVLHEGCLHARRLEAVTEGGKVPRMSINLSLKQIQHSDIVADVRDALETSGLAPERLVLEITESVLMDDTDLAVQRLCELKELGVALALDDFGTGYSSLSYLSRFPVDILKMDRSFLQEGSSPEARGLASAVVSLGATLALEVVAEGIEVAEQWDRLRDLGCGLGQGFLFARPLDAAASLAFVAGEANAP